MLKKTLTSLPDWAWLVLLIVLAVGVRVGWMLLCNYTEEDAFITFQFARQLASGQGFAHNSGQPIYGTTTPLLTLLLAGWFKLTGADMVSGARVFGMAAVVITFIFTWYALTALQVGRVSRAAVLLLLALTPRLVAIDTSGLEQSLALAGMAAAWWAAARGRPVAAGVVCGLLLWVRVDTLVWPAVLVLLMFLRDRRGTMRMAVAASLVYLPWVGYAWWVFGSPVPHTITAKWVFHALSGQLPLANIWSDLLNGLRPFRGSFSMTTLSEIFSTGMLGLAVWQGLRIRRVPWLAALPAFLVLETARLVVTRAVFSTRYFVPLTWVVLVLAGMGFGAGWEWVRSGRGARWGKSGVVVAAVMLTLGVITHSATWQARVLREAQLYRHEGSLKAVGMWLNQNTPPGATVQLEPLGYVGFYAQRVMLDEVGLITPAVVELKKKGFNDAYDYLAALDPDYVVIHCDDALSWENRGIQAQDGFQNYYRTAVFNPLNFDAESLSPAGRDACYEIWARDIIDP